MTERFMQMPTADRAATVDRVVDALQQAQLEQYATPAAARFRLIQLDRQLDKEGYSEKERTELFQTAADLIDAGTEAELEFELQRMLYE